MLQRKTLKYILQYNDSTIYNIKQRKTIEYNLQHKSTIFSMKKNRTNTNNLKMNLI